LQASSLFQTTSNFSNLKICRILQRMNELLPPQKQTPLQKVQLSLTPEGLTAAFLASFGTHTRRAYERDLRAWSEFLRVNTKEEGVKELLAQSSYSANALMHDYKAQMVAKGFASSYINRRLACLCSLVRLGRMVGLCSFEFKVSNVPVTSLRDTRGPGKEGVSQLLQSLVGKLDTKSIRDLALLRMLYGLALRRNEVLSLDFEHLEMEKNAERERLKLPKLCKEALEAWLLIRGKEPGPLFTSLSPWKLGERMSGNGLYMIVEKIGKKAGVSVKPHGLRHAAITEALEATNGNLRAVQKFSRHKDPKMLMIYDDARQDLQSQVADLVDSRT
jgi:integrase/recombinase XerC